MATRSSIPAWIIPWTEEPGGLQSMKSQRVGLDSIHTHIHTHKHTPGFEQNKALSNCLRNVCFCSNDNNVFLYSTGIYETPTTNWEDILVNKKLFCLCGAYIVVEMISKIYFFMLMNAMEKNTAK